MEKPVEILDIDGFLERIGESFAADRFYVVCVARGGFSCRINMRDSSCASSSLMVILQDRIVENPVFEKDTMCNIFSVSVSFADSLALPRALSSRLAIMRDACIPLSPHDLKAMSSLYDSLTGILSMEGNPYKEEILRDILRAFFFSIGYCILGLPDIQPGKSGRETLVFRYMRLVESNYRKRRNIGYYADILNTTSKYLSVTVKELTGLTALEHIEKYVMAYARARLAGSDDPVGQISDELAFMSQSDFGKYFKRLAGISPRDYRKETRH